MTILLNKILNTFKENIIPLTKKSVESGNKIFGAAILKKEDFSIVMTGANNEIENPLWHGEVHTLKNSINCQKKKGLVKKIVYLFLPMSHVVYV